MSGGSAPRGGEVRRIPRSFWRRAVYSFLLIAAIVVIGTLTMHALEGWSYLDSFYFTSFIATGQGPPGNLAVNDAGGKIVASSARLRLRGDGHHRATVPLRAVPRQGRQGRGGEGRRDRARDRESGEEVRGAYPLAPSSSDSSRAEIRFESSLRAPVCGFSSSGSVPFRSSM